MNHWPGPAQSWWQAVQAAWPDALRSARPQPPADDRVPAAVLVPFVLLDDGRPGIAFIQRPETMPHHPGQIAFPGGKIDPDDADALAAALRETNEEIGIPAARIELLGEIETFTTITSRFTITPVIGRLLDTRPSYVPNPREVDEVIEMPLAWLRDPAHRRVADAIYRGKPMRRVEYVWGERIIWGATARILDALLPRLPQLP
ncbi:MAG: CoA pyrophosphatase [Planctomycetota bacterium]